MNQSKVPPEITVSMLIEVATEQHAALRLYLAAHPAIDQDTLFNQAIAFFLQWEAAVK